MRLTIVLTVYNKESYLKRAFDALLNQSDTGADDYELLVVNDGSTDGSAAIIDEYVRHDSHIRVLTQNNQGLSMARNNGMQKSMGDYVWFVDSDDVVSRHSVRDICNAMSSQPDIIPIYAKTDGIEKTRNCINVDVHTGKDVLLSQWEHCSVFWVFRKNFLMDNNLRFLPGVYHEDAEFTPRALYAAKSVVVVPEVLYTVYRDPNSITQVPQPKRAFDCLTVAQHLNRFTEEQKERGTRLGRELDHNTSVLINNGFAVICKNSVEKQKHFNDTFRAMPELLRPLKAAPQLKYRIEAVLFRLFPGQYVSIYKLMKSFC